MFARRERFQIQIPILRVFVIPLLVDAKPVNFHDHIVILERHHFIGRRIDDDDAARIAGQFQIFQGGRIFRADPCEGEIPDALPIFPLIQALLDAGWTIREIRIARPELFL